MAHQTPPQVVIAAFRGVRPLARLLGKNPSTISRWGETIPSRDHLRILRVAQEQGIKITADDLVYGRDIDCDEDPPSKKST